MDTIEERLTKIKELTNMICLHTNEITHLQSQVHLKLSVEEFERQTLRFAPSSVTSQIESNIKHLNTVFKTFVVLLDESLRLHHRKPDESAHERANRTALAIQQLNMLVNSVEREHKALYRVFSQTYNEQIDEEVALQHETKTSASLPPGLRKSLLQGSSVAILTNQKQKSRCHSSMGHNSQKSRRTIDIRESIGQSMTNDRYQSTIKQIEAFSTNAPAQLQHFQTLELDGTALLKRSNTPSMPQAFKLTKSVERTSSNLVK